MTVEEIRKICDEGSKPKRDREEAMTVEEIRKICDEALKSDDPCLASLKTLLPALLAVLEGAKDFINMWMMKDVFYTQLAKALNDLDNLELPK